MTSSVDSAFIVRHSTVCVLKSYSVVARRT